MDTKQLRKMVREEIESVLDEQITLDEHPKFRRLVAERLGRPLEQDECYHGIWRVWNEMMTECAGEEPEQDLVEYYVERAVSLVEN
jgi:hypothetical protein